MWISILSFSNTARQRLERATQFRCCSAKLSSL